MEKRAGVETQATSRPLVTASLPVPVPQVLVQLMPVVHGHLAEGFANVLRGGERVGHAHRSLGVHVDEPHLHGRHRVEELAVRSAPERSAFRHQRNFPEG
jgi:hypothetical protein